MRSTETRQQTSWGELLQGRNGLRSIALAGGVALHAVNIYVVTTILPTIIDEIGGLGYYAWNTTLFVVASIVGSVLSARLIDTMGPRLAYLLALAGFSLGVVVCATAASMPILLLGRTVQGLGGGVLFALSYALIRVVFDPRLWPRAMALVSGMWGVATLCGPAVGGVFAQTGHWRWAFWSLLPVALLLALIVLVQFGGRTVGSAASTRVPLRSMVLLVLAVLTISIGSLSRQLAWNVIGILIGVVITVVIARIDMRADTKLLPSGAWSLSTQLGVIYAMMGLLVAGMTTEIFVPYFLQVIHGMTPLAAGYMTAIMAGGWTLASLYSAGRGEAGLTYRFIRISPLIVLMALLVLAVAMPITAWGGALVGSAVYCFVLAAVGFGIGLSWPHLLTRVFSAAVSGEETLASSSITTVQLYATALAAALAGVAANAGGLTDPGGVEGARSAALTLFASFAVAPLLAALLSARVRR
ncbi:MULTISPECIES: MFS transporter [Burkholderia]|uniref:MFS transporter n=1 Tax=Burkholderia TaxID=32008 RepID=UPI000753663C|nr:MULTISPECIES: MFS transporter [Burkholderia]AOI82871.1 MFS transporter [Burkholderia cepacia]KUY53890.1 MFS transporter [Burkholderia sp. RF2-non_BP3]